MKMCPMMKGDMEEMARESKEAPGGPAEEAKAESSDEHSSHH